MTPTRLALALFLASPALLACDKGADKKDAKAEKKADAKEDKEAKKDEPEKPAEKKGEPLTLKPASKVNPRLD